MAEDAVEMERGRIKEAKEKMKAYLLSSFGNQLPIPVPEEEIVMHTSTYKGIMDAIARIDP